MNFSEKISELQSLYRLQHDLSNKISEATFAEERGHLSEEDKTELEQRTREYERRNEEAEVLREAVRTEFPNEYTAHLSTLHKQLTSINTYLSAMTGEIEFKHRFNKTICESLLSDLTKVIQNKKTKYDPNWLFDVSDRLAHEYKPTLKF